MRRGPGGVSHDSFGLFQGPEAGFMLWRAGRESGAVLISTHKGICLLSCLHYLSSHEHCKESNQRFSQG